MKKISILMISLLIGAAVLSGCGKKEEKPVKNDSAVVGTWSEDFFDSGYIFNDDGTGTDTFWDLTFTYTATGGKLEITYDSDLYGIAVYSYTVRGDTLTMTREDADESFAYTKQTQQSQQGQNTTAADDADTDETSDEEETKE